MKKAVKWVLPLAVAGALVVPASPVYAAEDSVKQLKQTIKKLKKSNKKLEKSNKRIKGERDALQRQNKTLTGTVAGLEQELRAAKPAGQTGVRMDGTWRLNLDITAGTWRTAGTNAGCYWERVSDLSGEFESIIANNFANGPMVVTFPSSDAAVTFSGGCAWTKV